MSRRFQFSLKTLFVAIAAVWVFLGALGLGWELRLRMEGQLQPPWAVWGIGNEDE